MPKTRNTKCDIKDASTTSSISPSTSSQSAQQTSSRRRASPFRGFEGNVDQTELVRMSRLIAIDAEDEGSEEKASQAELKEKRKRSSSPSHTKAKQVKMSKVFSSDKENIDLLKKAQAKANFDKKKTQDRSNKKEKTVYVDDSRNDNVKDMGGKSFLGCESKGGNFVNVFNNMQRGLLKPSVFEEMAEHVTLRSLRWFRVFIMHETSDLRVTAMAWHPTSPHIFVSGGKAGTLVLYKINESKTFDIFDPQCKIPGVGPGGTMENIRFSTKHNELVIYTASVDGSIARYDFETCKRKPLVQSSNPVRTWFCTVDPHQDGKSVYGGDSNGSLAIHHLDSGEIEYNPDKKIHSSKIRHLEFSPRDPNLLVTSSLDKTVKLWDIRKLDGKKSYIERLDHSGSVSSAKFSRTDGCRLLTTDQYAELRVYKAPLWDLEHNIVHPHRHFQHLTLIRASWNPTADLFVVGRYPDPKLKTPFDDIRSVDVYSALSAKLCVELTDTSSLITSLAEFNHTGDYLASSAGRTLYIWKDER